MRLDPHSHKLPQTLATVAMIMATVPLLPTAAFAANTTIHSHSATGAAYTGNIQLRLIGHATVSSSVGDGRCNQSTMTGAVRSDGSQLTMKSVSFTNNNGPCGSNTKVALTPQNMPWTGGSIAYAPVSNGRDGTFTIHNFKIKAQTDSFGGVTCYFAGNLVAESYNPTNTRRPHLAIAEHQLRVKDAVVKKANGSDFLCPSSATVNATYQLNGQSSQGYDIPLFITG